jgi:hypothetical protein
MAEHVSDWLHLISTGWGVLATLGVFLLFVALVLPTQSARSEAETGDVGSPDTFLFYTPRTLYGLAEAYGPEGQRAYIEARFTFDAIWPLVYTAFLSTAISWLYRKTFQKGSWWQRLNLVPVLGALLDYLENASTSLVMWRYPRRTTVVAMLAPVFTLSKWMLVAGSFVLLAVGVGVGLWRGARGRAE